MTDEEFKKLVHRKIKNATVKIFVGGEFRGTGFFITPDGYLLTAYHCVGEYAPDIVVKSPFKEEFKARLEKDKSLTHRDFDIAVLKTDRKSENCLPLGRVSKHKVIDGDVIALGYPAGKIPGNEDIGTYLGNISKFRDNKIEIPNAIKGPGQSGGPVYHYATIKVIGLVLAGYEQDEMRDTGLAVRFDSLYERWPELESINSKVFMYWKKQLGIDEDKKNCANCSTPNLHDSIYCCNCAEPFLPELKRKFEEGKLFGNDAGHLFLSPSEPDTSKKENLFEELEGQKLVGEIKSITPNFFDVEIKGCGSLEILRPEVDLEVCNLETGDKIALQVREGLPMLQTTAQIQPINEKEYYYATTVDFFPERYDSKKGHVVGKVDGIRAFARLLGESGDIIIKNYQKNIPSNHGEYIVPITDHKSIPLAVLESIYFDGAWCLLLSSELQERKSHFIRAKTDEMRKISQLQRSYMFDYLEYQNILNGKIVIRKEKMTVRIERIVNHLKGGNLFPIYTDPASSLEEGEMICLKNFGVIRETGDLAIYPCYGKSEEIHPASLYRALFITKRGDEYCASIKLAYRNTYKTLPVVVDFPESLETPSFGTVIPFKSVISITETVWDEKDEVFKGKIVSVDPDDLNLQDKSSSGWIWYYSKIGEDGQIWGVNANAGVWVPLYPYNHLLNRKGIPVKNSRLLKDCEKKFDNTSHFKNEKDSLIFGTKNKGILKNNNGIYELEIKWNDYLRILGNEELIFDENGEIIEGRIIGIDEHNVSIESEPGIAGKIPFSEFTNLSDIVIGNTIEVFTAYEIDDNGQIILSKMIADSLRNWERINTIYENSEIVSGKVLKRVKGGIIVELLGFNAFMPGSLIDLKSVPDHNKLIGEQLKFKVLNITITNKKNIVVSRRCVLEEDRDKNRKILIREIKEGDVRKGIVTNIVDYGVFVDLGGLNGLLYINDISWEHVEHPSSILSVGEQITVKILSIDIEKRRVSLGMKQLTQYPSWATATDKYPVGSRITGKIIRLTDYGAFAELENGIEGLIHVSDISWTKKIKHPSQVYKKGDVVQAVVLDIDKDKKKLSLGIRQMQLDPWETAEERYEVGTKITGTVKNITDFGVFVELEEEGIEGLLHVSEISFNKKMNTSIGKFDAGDTLTTIIINIDREEMRISLSIKQLEPNLWDTINERYPVGTNIEGKIIEIDWDGIIVDLEIEKGLIGFIPIDESALKVVHLSQVFTVGENISAKIINVNKAEYEIILSINEYLNEKDEEFRLKWLKDHPVKEATPNMIRIAKVIDSSSEAPIKAVVRKIEAGRIYVNINSIKGYINTKNLSENFQTALVNENDIIEIEYKASRDDKLIFALVPDKRMYWDADDIKKRYRVGEKIRCKILRVLDYHIFVELEENVVGVVKFNVFIRRKYEINNYIDLYIISIDPEEQKIFLDSEKNTFFQDVSVKSSTENNEIGLPLPMPIIEEAKLPQRQISDVTMPEQDSEEAELKNNTAKEAGPLSVKGTSSNDNTPTKMIPIPNPVIISKSEAYSIEVSDILKSSPENPIKAVASQRTIDEIHGIQLDINGIYGFISSNNFLNNFQTALVKNNDVIYIYEEGSKDDKLRFAMVPDKQKYWIADITEKYKVGTKVECRILKILTCGVFVELEKNVVGFVTLDDLVGSNKTSDVKYRYDINDYINLCITSVKPEEQKIFLTRKVTFNAKIRKKKPEEPARIVKRAAKSSQKEMPISPTKGNF